MTTHDDCIVFLLAKANQKAQSIFKKVLKPYGLTTVQSLIIQVLMEEDGIIAGEIGKRLVLDNATVSGVLDRLLDSGWIRKETDVDDKRAMRVYLADKAFSMKKDLFRLRDDVDNLILTDFSYEERLFFKRLLKDLRNQ